MENILFIHSNPLVDKAVDLLKNDVRDQLNVVNDFDEGLRLVFEKRPAVIFIQHEISGVSSIAVANHIKTLLRDNAPQIVLLQDDPAKKIFAGRELFDEVIVIEDDSTALFHDFLSLLQLMPSIDFKSNESSSFSDGSMADVVTNSEELVIPQLPDGATFDSHDSFQDIKIEEPDSLLLSDAESEVEFQIVQELQSPETESTTITAPVAEDREIVIELSGSDTSDSSNLHPLSQIKDSTAESQQVNIDSEDTKDLESEWIDLSATRELPPYEQVFSLRKERNSFTLLKYAAVAVFVIAVAGGGYVLFKPGSSDSSGKKQIAELKPEPQIQVSSNAKQSPEKPLVKPAEDAFPVIPPIFSSLDITVVSKSSAGWETRKGNGYTFKLYRENSRIRAAQLVADTVSGLPDNSVSAILSMAGDGFTDIGTNIQKNITLKQKKNSRGCESVAYFRKGTEKPIAVVVSFN